MLFPPLSCAAPPTVPSSFLSVLSLLPSVFSFFSRPFALPLLSLYPHPSISAKASISASFLILMCLPSFFRLVSFCPFHIILFTSFPVIFSSWEVVPGYPLTLPRSPSHLVPFLTSSYLLFLSSFSFSHPSSFPTLLPFFYFNSFILFALVALFFLSFLLAFPPFINLFVHLFVLSCLPFAYFIILFYSLILLFTFCSRCPFLLALSLSPNISPFHFHIPSSFLPSLSPSLSILSAYSTS